MNLIQLRDSFEESLVAYCLTTIVDATEFRNIPGAEKFINCKSRLCPGYKQGQGRKKCFPDKKTALEFMALVNSHLEELGYDKPQRSAYWCNYCNAWHTTTSKAPQSAFKHKSQEERQRAKMASEYLDWFNSQK